MSLLNQGFPQPLVAPVALAVAQASARPVTGTLGVAPAPVDAYAANGFSPDYVADFSAASADYFRVAGADSDFATAFTSDSEGGGLATQNDSSGNLVWRPHNLLPDPANGGANSNVTVTPGASDPDGGTSAFNVVQSGSNCALGQSVAVALGDQYTMVVTIKVNTGRWVRVLPSNVVVFFDADNDFALGSTSSGYVSSQVENLGGGWYRVTVVGEEQIGGLRQFFPATVQTADGSTTELDGADFDVYQAHAYRSDLGGMADNPDAATGLEKYVPTTTAARYLARRRHHRWDGSAYVPTCLHEPISATNRDPNSDDLSAWTTSNTTIAKNQTGADGVANSAHSITATANSGTALEQITAASAAHAWGCLMKRITGTGTVEVTVNGGSTWVDITSQLSTSVFLPVSTGAGVTVTNPEFGVRLGTSGDVVAVQVSQLEQTSGFISSPVPTSGSTVTRTADTLKGKAASLPWSSTAVSMAIKGRHNRTSGVAATLLARYEDADDSLELRVDSSNNAEAYAETGGSSQTASGGAVATGAGAAYSLAMRYVAGSAIQVATGGTAGSEVTSSVPATPPLSDNNVLILEGSGTGDVNGTVDRVIGWDEDIAEAGIESGSASVEIQGLPTISGTEAVGSTLTASAATVVGGPSPSTTWQWQRSANGTSGWADISGATSSTYTLVSADEDQYVRAVQTSSVTAGGDTYTDSANSVASGQIANLTLDTVTSAVLAFSVARKLRTAYSGSAIRVRRSSDNAEQDIGFTAVGVLDEAALTTFCGAVDGFIVKVYDQSGATGAEDYTQSTAAAQPQIVSSGSVVKKDTYTAMQQPASTDFVTLVTWPGAASVTICEVWSTPASRNCVPVSSAHDSATFSGSAENGSASTALVGTAGGGPVTYRANGTLVATNGSDSRDTLHTAWCVDALQIVRHQGLDLSQAGIWDQMRTTYFTGASSAFPGPEYWSEQIVLSSASVADVSAIESNQATAYGITLA